MNTKKIPYFLYLLLLGVSLNAWSQHGIGTNTPNPNAVLELTSPDSDKGFLAPRVALTSSSTLFTGVTATASDTGLLVYNTSTTSSTASGLQGSGFYFWNGTYWERFTTSTENNLVTSLDCHAATFSGTIISGEAANLTVSLPYSGGDGSGYAGETTISSGIELGMTGLTATLQAGTLANGTGILTHVITGTPTESGDAYFGVDFGGESCVLVVPITDSSSGGTATVSNWDCSGTATGTLYRGEEAAGVSKIVYADVTKAGTYDISITNNGITYSAKGTFVATGNNIAVTLQATGTPIAAGTTSFTLFEASPASCSFEVEVLDRSSGGTASVEAWNCAAGTSSGTLYRNEDTTGDGIYKTIVGEVSQLGSYDFTATANGVTYTASGTFTTLGSQTVTLTATGTPADTGTHAYALSTTPSCTFDLTTIDRSSGGTAILAFNCAVNVPTGTVTATEAVVGVTQEIQADVTKAGTYNISTDEVNGITFANSGTLAVTGIQSITLLATGTATAAGTSTYTLNTSPTCSFDREAINNITGDATFVLPINNLITSYDAENGGVGDIQGVVDNATNQVTYTVPYTAGSGEYAAYTSDPITLTGENGDTNTLTISYPLGTFAATGNISVTVTVAGADTSFDVEKQLASMTALFATFDFKVNGTSKGNLTLTAIGGIPDRRYGDGSGHDFVYLEVTNPTTGKTWLNHNLGAHYANVNHPSYDPQQQATSYDDYLAYGSSFQWGRYSDGHELINWTSATSGTAVNPITTPINSDSPTHGNFITETSDPKDWRINPSDTLWDLEAANNPCPDGYRVPKDIEIDGERFTWANYNRTGAFDSPLKLTTAGFRRNSDAAFINLHTGYYWTTSIFGNDDKYVDTFLFDSTTSYLTILNRVYGQPVRCIKD